MAKKKPVKRAPKRQVAQHVPKETELEEVIRRLGWTDEVAGLQARFVRGILNQR